MANLPILARGQFSMSALFLALFTRISPLGSWVQDPFVSFEFRYNAIPPFSHYPRGHGLTTPTKNLMHFTPLLFENFDYAWSFSAELSPEGLIGIAGSTLR